MKSLLDLNIDEIKQILIELKQPQFRAKQIYKWLTMACDFDQMTDVPKTLLATLANSYSAQPLRIVNELTSSDGTKKFLYELNDGETVEGVLMDYKYGSTLCVSTQVGCRMNCAFCASGIDGLIRNLTAGEILGQVVAVNKLMGGTMGDRRITNVVLMGSGEPLDNYDNVTKFFDLVNSVDGLNISQRNISVSTCGLVDKIIQLADDGYSVTLTISLHATTDETRQDIMPIAKKYNINELINAARYYFDRTGRRVIIEYSMIKGKNINFFDAKRLGELTRGLSAHVNLIMLNYVKEKDIEGCTKDEAERFLERLTALGVSASIRRSMGSDIAGACGQLRRKVMLDKVDKADKVDNVDKDKIYSDKVNGVSEND